MKVHYVRSVVHLMALSVDGWFNGCVNGWTDGWVVGCTYVCKDGWVIRIYEREADR